MVTFVVASRAARSWGRGMAALCPEQQQLWTALHSPGASPKPAAVRKLLRPRGVTQCSWCEPGLAAATRGTGILHQPLPAPASCPLP